MKFLAGSAALKVYLLWAVIISLIGCNALPSATEKPAPPGRSSTPVVRNEPVIAFCELVSNPERYRDKLVRTQATVITFPENAYVYDPSCYKKDALTWLDFGGDEPYEVLNEKLRDVHKPGKPNRLYVTALGRFEGPAKEGFGHLGGFKYRFVLMAVEDTKAVPDQVSWPWDLKESQ